MIAGGGVRAVLELGGIRDVLAKSLGTTNPINMVKAAEQALRHAAAPRGGREGTRQADAATSCPYKAPVVEAEEVSSSGEAEADAGA